VCQRGHLTQLRASKNEFAEDHSQGSRTAGLDLLLLEPVVWSTLVQLFSCSLLDFRSSLVRDMSCSRPEISRSIFFQVHRGFPAVRDYWSGKRRDPIVTANSVKSIIESSWFLKKVDVNRSQRQNNNPPSRGWELRKKGKKQKLFLVLSSRPGPDGPNASGWYRRLLEPISPFLMFNSVQLWQLFSSGWTILLSTIIHDLDSRITAKHSKCKTYQNVRPTNIWKVKPPPYEGGNFVNFNIEKTYQSRE